MSLIGRRRKINHLFIHSPSTYTYISSRKCPEFFFSRPAVDLSRRPIALFSRHFSWSYTPVQRSFFQLSPRRAQPARLFLGHCTSARWRRGLFGSAYESIQKVDDDGGDERPVCVCVCARQLVDRRAVCTRSSLRPCQQQKEYSAAYFLI